jgi:hypothetical protein
MALSSLYQVSLCKLLLTVVSVYMPLIALLAQGHDDSDPWDL